MEKLRCKHNAQTPNPKFQTPNPKPYTLNFKLQLSVNNLAPKLTNKQYAENFAELKPALSPNAATAEAIRCLYCFDSPCMKACPTHIDISTFIKKIATGNLKGSAKTILESNWVPLTCAKACPVDVLCEGACVYNEGGEKPIQIGRLQRFAIDNYFEQGMPPLFTPAPKNGRSIGVIGGGPAGLACAAELALMGYEVTIYEAKDKAGGLDTWGIAPYKMKHEDSAKEVALVKSFGVKIKTGVNVGNEISIEKLTKMHVIIFIGVGLGRATRLNIPGEDLEGVVDAQDFIEDVTTRKWKSVKVGKRVAIIGGGNTAIDAATEAKRLGAQQVMMIYRRSREEMSAYEFEQELALTDSVEFFFSVMPRKFIGKKSVEAIECVRTKVVNGKVKPVPRSEFKIPIDMVIKALGQTVEESFLSEIPNLKTNQGNVWVNPETYQTSNPKYFAGGDCINGGKEVVNAAYDGKSAAHGIDAYLSIRS
jgi:glutamate synthase (NADPH/NADH) small chain